MSKIGMYVFYGFTIYFLIDFFLKVLFSIITKCTVEKTLYQKRMNHKINYQYYRPVSIIIPINGSEQEFINCLESVVNLDYKQFEILLIAKCDQKESYLEFIEKNKLIKVSRPFKKVLDTKKIDCIYEGFYKNVPVTFVLKEASILPDDYNAGVNIARYPYILTLKDNQEIKKNALKEFVRTIMQNEEVVLCSGVTIKKFKTTNIFSFLENWRITNLFVKNTCFEIWNGNLFFSNSFCFFKKDLFLEMKGFSLKNGFIDGSFLARFHIFLKRLKSKYYIRYVLTANIIEYPLMGKEKNFLNEETKSFLLGLLHNKKLLFQPKYGLLSFFTYTYYFFFEFLKPLFLLIEIILVLSFLFTSQLSWWIVLVLIFLFIFFPLWSYYYNYTSLKKLLKERKTEIDHVIIN